MAERYRVTVCGTGGVGGAVLREALRLPWLDVVGVQVYTDAKVGLDAGEMVGLPAAGVITTDDPEQAVALDAGLVQRDVPGAGDALNRGFLGSRIERER
jgi:hypothetical protein